MTTQAESLRAALERTLHVLDTLNHQARDGGGSRGQVYVTIETWREVAQPAIRQAAAVLAATPPAEEGPVYLGCGCPDGTHENSLDAVYEAHPDIQRMPDRPAGGWFFGAATPPTEGLDVERLHRMLGNEGEGYIGVWTHRPTVDGDWTSPEGRFYTFRVEDVHATIDQWAAREYAAATHEEEGT